MKRTNCDLYQPYEKLVNIRIENRTYHVPENNTILRAFQYLSADLTRAKLCWNGECENCLFTFRIGDERKERIDLACRQIARADMEIITIPAGIKLRK